MIWISSLCGDAQTEILEKHSRAWYNQITVISSRFADFNSLSWISISSQKKDGFGLNVSWDIFEKIYAFLSIPLCNLPIRNTIRRSGNSKNRYHCNYCTKLDDNIFLCPASNENVNVRRHRSKQHPPQSRPNNKFLSLSFFPANNRPLQYIVAHCGFSSGGVCLNYTMAQHKIQCKNNRSENLRLFVCADGTPVSKLHSIYTAS